jgi:predicted O-methyltransferase YrrM
MSAGGTAWRDAGRFLAANAILELAGRRESLARSGLRLLEASPAARVARSNGREDPASRAVARALRATGLGRIPPPERRWIDRIEHRRTALAAAHGVTQAVFSEEPDARGDRWAHVGRAGPLAAKCDTISVPARWGILLVRLVSELTPRSCVELGTGFGVSAAFIAAALELNGEGALTTFEGAEEWAAIAREGAGELDLARLAVRVGPLSETLPAALPDLAPVDFAFVDAEHTKESTLRYFDQLLPHLSAQAVLLFDDIDFDREMWDAWEEIREHPRVHAWAALGRMGIVRVART